VALFLWRLQDLIELIPFHLLKLKVKQLTLWGGGGCSCCNIVMNISLCLWFYDAQNIWLIQNFIINYSPFYMLIGRTLLQWILTLISGIKNILAPFVSERNVFWQRWFISSCRNLDAMVAKRHSYGMVKHVCMDLKNVIGLEYCCAWHMKSADVLEYTVYCKMKGT
jgi:hypothetical protein